MIATGIKNNIESLQIFSDLLEPDIKKICLIHQCIQGVTEDLVEKYYKEYWSERLTNKAEDIEPNDVKYIFESWFNVIFACSQNVEEKHNTIFWAIGDLEGEHKLAPVVIQRGINFLRHEAQMLVVCDDENLPLTLKLELVVSIFKVLDLSELILNECL